MPKKLLMLVFAVLLLAVLAACENQEPAKTAQEPPPPDMSAYDPATIAILEEIIARNYPNSKTIKTPLNFKAVWTDTEPKQLVELDLKWATPARAMVLHDLPYLETLHLYSHMEGMSGGYVTLENLPSLKTLIAEKRRIKNITDIKGLNTLAALKYLNLDENEITKIEGLEALVFLESLSLERNKITKLEGLTNLPKLRWLNLWWNEINEIENLDNLPQLSHLNLSKNQLIDIDGIKNLINLHILELGENQIISVEALKNLTNLQTLKLGDNQITDIDILKNLPGLNELEINKNQIVDLRPLRNLTGLIKLKAGTNRIKTAEGLGSLTSLEELSLSGNPLENADDLQYLKNMKKLYIGTSVLNDLNFLENLTLLKELGISYSSISDYSGLANIKGPLEKLRIFNSAMSDKDIKFITENKVLQNTLQNLELTNINSNPQPDLSPFLNLKQLTKFIFHDENLIAVKNVETFITQMRANNINQVKVQINISGHMPLSELYKFWQSGMIIREQKNVFFESLELKVGEVLVLPENEMEIGGKKTGIRVMRLLESEFQGKRNREICKKTKILK